MENRSITVNDQTYSYYICGSGDAVLYLAGFGTPSIVADFYPHIAPLKTDHRLVLLERLGYGQSSDGLEKDLAPVIRQLISREALTNITLVGHSLGGLYAIDIAKQLPELSRLVLLDTFPINGPMLFINRFMGRMTARARAKGRLNRMPDEKLLKMAHCPPGLPDELRQTTLELIRTRLYNESVLGELELFKGSVQTIFDGMEGIQAKTISICRKQTYRANLGFRDRIPVCEVIRVEGGSHFVHHDHVELVRKVITGER